VVRLITLAKRYLYTRLAPESRPVVIDLVGPAAWGSEIDCNSQLALLLHYSMYSGAKKQRRPGWAGLSFTYKTREIIAGDITYPICLVHQFEALTLFSKISLLASGDLYLTLTPHTARCHHGIRISTSGSEYISLAHTMLMFKRLPLHEGTAYILLKKRTYTD
jgi:hypothetical protein